MSSKKKNNDYPVSAILRYPLYIFDTDTKKQVSTEEFNEYCHKTFELIKKVQQEMIIANVDTMPERTGKSFGAEWARKNVALVSVPKTYAVWSKVNVINQSEAARIILSYREREEVASNLDKIGWDVTYDTYCKKTNTKYLRRQLFENVKRHGGHFNIPKIKTARITYERVNGSLCRMNVYDDSTIVEFCLGERRFAAFFETKDIAIRYRNVEHISRPTLLDSETPVFIFAIKEHIPKEDTTGGLVAFDRNMDSTKPISGVRVYPDGNLSKELSWSVDTERHIIKAKKLSIELKRCKDKKANLMPWQDSTNLDKEIERLTGKLYKIHDAIDFSIAADIDKHTTVNDIILLEYLSWAQGGPIKFRHGRSDEIIVHRLQRSGKHVTFVSPKNTSHTCPACGEYIENIKLSDRSVTCPKCKTTYCRDNGASVRMAQDFLDDETKINYNKKSRPVKPFGTRPPKNIAKKKLENGKSCLVNRETGEIVKEFNSKIDYDDSVPGILLKGSIPSKSRSRQAIQLISGENGLMAWHDYYFDAKVDDENKNKISSTIIKV